MVPNLFQNQTRALVRELLMTELMIFSKYQSNKNSNVTSTSAKVWLKYARETILRGMNLTSEAQK